MTALPKTVSPTARGKWMRRSLTLLLLIWVAWSALAIGLGHVGPNSVLWLRSVVGVLALVASAAVWGLRGRIAAAWSVAAICLSTTVWFASISPANDRNWNEDQSRLPSVHFDGDLVHITDLRAFRYRSPDDWDTHWFDATYDLSTLQGVDFAVERFTENEAVAHTLLSFVFEDGRALAVSVEIRKEVGESYGVVAGMFRQYELMVVLGDERDLLELRAVHRKDAVYLHPMTASKAASRALLEGLLHTAEDLRTQPRWYHTVTASCTSVLAQHLTSVADVPLDHRVYLPGYSDALAFELGLINTDVDFATTRLRNHINANAEAAAGSASFSQRIREGRTDGDIRY